jgi:ABC-2 type transport system permease protein
VQIPAGLGAIGCLLLARWIPRARKQALVVGGLLLAALAAWIGWSLLAGDRGNWLTAAWFQDLMARFRFAEHRLLPSWWLSTGLLEAARGDWSESLLFLTVCTANALLVHVVALQVAGRVLRPSFDRLIGGRTSRRHVGLSWIDRAVAATAFYLPEQTRLLIVKDARLYRRDPVQWSQFLIFFGLLGLYFLNVRQFRYDVHYVAWVNVIAFLNLAVVGLILATFTSRFIYPMVSLEGRRFWILGLLPLSRDTILWGKFLFGAIGALLPSLALIALSDLMLRVAPLVLVLHMLICVLLCFGLAGISVGLGALMPNLREESPSKIAAGFGGTLTLVLSTIYIAVVVLLTAVPCHFYFTSNTPGSLAYASRGDVGKWLAFGLAGSCLLALVATVAPMRMGFRAFRRLEF